MLELYPEQPDDSIWVEFIQVESDLGRTFDPLQFLLACRRDTVPSEPYESWEEFYRKNFSVIGYDLISLVKNHREKLDADGSLELAIKSVERIAEILPVKDIPNCQAPGSRNDMLHSLFWVHVEYHRKEECIRIFEKNEALFSQEQKFYMEFAIKGL